MSEKKAQTQAMLARHHRDGERFADLMKESFESRFDANFWAAWGRWMDPVLSDPPVILDLGAGPGLFLRALGERYPGVRAIGVECAPYMLQAAVDLPPGCEMVNEDLHDPHLPLTDGSVDAALASVVVHEMNQPLRTLQEVRRCLKPGGRLYLLDWVRAPLAVYVATQSDEGRVFDRETPVDELDDLFVHFMEHNRYAVEDLVWLLEQTGFEILHREVVKDGRYARLVAARRD